MSGWVSGSSDTVRQSFPWLSGRSGRMKQHYYAAGRRRHCEAVCRFLRDSYGLPEFMFDSHDSWRYGWLCSAAIGFNVTKAANFATVETWMAECPRVISRSLLRQNLLPKPGACS